MSELAENSREFIEILTLDSHSDFDFEKPAIEWNVPDFCSQNGNGENSLYWDISQKLSDTDGHKKILSYSTVIGIIRRIICGLRTSNFYNRKQSPPIFAVSIPEGIFLPLAILSTFMLNVTSADDEAPIIMPLDPDEGKDRLVHMLLDAKPSVILFVGRKDEEKLNLACAAVTDSGYSPLMINIKQLVENESNVLQDLQTSGSIGNRLSHIVYTSGTTGHPKGCKSSLSALYHYIKVKNKSHEITTESKVFLASALPFDPCLSDIIATFAANATLCICPRETMKGTLGSVLVDLRATHILCTPSLWSGVNSEKRNELGCLEVVALGGEVMSNRIRGWWARKRNDPEGKIKLMSTYGVTEVCVYQTIGEVFADTEMHSRGQDIGFCFEGLGVRICQEPEVDKDDNVFILQDVINQGSEGEIVLEGRQLDQFSGYLNMPESTKIKFTSLWGSDKTLCYRTGDRGYIDPATNRLHILGRIGGEEGMVKINGVRVELGEIEHSILDSVDFTLNENLLHLVIGCVVTVDVVDDEGTKKLTAYCVLSDRALHEIGIINFPDGVNGIICPPSPLLVALRSRCQEKVRKGSIPSTFIILERIPLTRTGKINRQALPTIQSCTVLQEVVPGHQSSTHLSKYGRCGQFITNELITCLNLHASQQEMITTTASFALLGGDSLAATRIVRALYASHHGLENSRTLGGMYGTFEGAAFNASNLIHAKTLGDYIDFLDSSGVLEKFDMDDSRGIALLGSKETGESSSISSKLFDALMQAITLNQSTVAIALLAEGADPNFKNNGRRLGNTSGRFEQRDAFKSSPMHLACAKSDVYVVRALLEIGKCNCKTPDSSGTYPLHLACSGLGESSKYDAEEDKRRLQCVQLLLEEGNVPLPMKNSSKQTVLHCAARGGYSILLDYLLDLWQKDDRIVAVKQWGTKCDWQDRWFRTPVHWAVLHKNIDALKVLLKHGCSSRPPKPKVNSGKRTSGKVEYPEEICERLHGDDKLGMEILSLLKNG